MTSYRPCSQINIFLTKVKYTFKYTSSILQPVESQKKKYTSNLCYFNKGSTFEAHLVKLNQYF